MSGGGVKAWFNGLPPDRKRKLVVGGGLLLVLVGVLLAVIATEQPKDQPATTSRKGRVDASILTGRDPQRIGIEQLQAANKRLENQIETQGRLIQSLMNGQQAGPRGQSGQLPYPYAGPAQEVVALPGSSQEPGKAAGPSSVDAPKAPDRAVQQAIAGANRGAAPALPPPNIPGVTANDDVYGPSAPAETAAPEVPPPPPKLKLRVLTPREQSSAAPDAGPPQPSLASVGGARAQPASLSALARGAAPREQEYYIPMGSILAGTLLTGVDAPANGASAKRDPFPALFRVKGTSVLPNFASMDLRECFIVASAFGDLSSERVYMRAEGLSCVRGDGAIIEASLDAYLTGPDGKAGVRGTVVEKTGALVARSLMAGFVSGMAKAFQPQIATPVNVTGPNQSGGSTASFQVPNVQYVLGTSVLSGASSAAERVASIYEDLARQIVPVIEISAGIPVDFILTRGTTIRFKRVGELSAGRGQQPGAPQSQQQSRANQSDSPVTSVTGSTGAGFSVTPGPSSSTPPRAPPGVQAVTGAIVGNPATNPLGR